MNPTAPGDRQYATTRGRSTTVAVAIVGDFDPSFEPHPVTQTTLTQAGASLGVQIEFEWLSTEALSSTVGRLAAFNGLWIAPGSPYRSMHGALNAIKYARERNVPLLGTCGGFQHIILEYARNVLGIRDAQHAEYDPYASFLFISRLVCPLAGRSLPISLKPSSRVAEMYGKTNITEKYYCNFGLNPDYLEVLQSRDLRIVGSDAEGEARIIELTGHPFFVGTLFVPNLYIDAPHPLVRAFVASSMAAVTRSTQTHFDLQPILEGELLRLRPLRPKDWHDLYGVASDPLIWEQHPNSDRYKEDVFKEFFREALESGGALIVIDSKNDQVIGSSRFYGYDQEKSEIEIGWTFLARSRWGGIYNKEMKRLMLRHAFRFVKNVVFLVGPGNLRSQRAMEQIGGVRVESRPDEDGRDKFVFQITTPPSH